MAVVVKCSICGKFIKDVETKDLRTLTGKEICEDCGKKLASYLADLESYVNECKANITAQYKETHEYLKKMESVYKSYTESTQGLFTTMKADVNAKLEKILHPEG